MLPLAATFSPTLPTRPAAARLSRLAESTCMCAGAPARRCAFHWCPVVHGFVKNLESVQGDERDIIIFSIGYGRDEAGRFTLQFGPLNKLGGYRRLNVAITRARRRVEVVSSIEASDFVGDLRSDGVRHLRRYLDFAGRPENRLAALGVELGPSGRDSESPFEEEVARVVRSWGYDVVPQVGCADYRIDMAVRHPAHLGRYALGISAMAQCITLHALREIVTDFVRRSWPV